MKKVTRRMRQFLSDESGQGTMEYILIVGLIVIFLILALYLFRDQLLSFIKKVQAWLGEAEGEVGQAPGE